MTRNVEYRVRPVIRYHVTRFESDESEIGACGCGLESLGEFDNESQAFKIADALFYIEIKDLPRGVSVTSSRGDTFSDKETK